MKLFAFYIGGRLPAAHIELHDFRVCAGDSVASCYDDLRAQWWGTPQSLHLDCWGALEQADGYDIAVKDHPNAGDMKLFFINLGGYDPALFTELHSNVFVVAENEGTAKVKALKAISEWKSHHKDNQYEVEQVINVQDLFKGPRYIHLTPAVTVKPFIFDCGYRPIGKTR